MSRSQTTHSHLMCPTCQGDISDNKDLQYFGGTGDPHANDDILGRYEEVSHLMLFLGTLAQAGPLAVAESEESIIHEWVSNLAWLARELTEETERRLQLLEQAGQIWKRRAEQSPERKEG